MRIKEKRPVPVCRFCHPREPMNRQDELAIQLAIVGQRTSVIPNRGFSLPLVYETRVFPSRTNSGSPAASRALLSMSRRTHFGNLKCRFRFPARLRSSSTTIRADSSAGQLCIDVLGMYVMSALYMKVLINVLTEQFAICIEQFGHLYRAICPFV